jgi:hypothetical protein
VPGKAGVVLVKSTQIHSNPLEPWCLLSQKTRCEGSGDIGKPQILPSTRLKSLKSLESLVGIWFGPNRFFQFGNSS